jgi:LPXTG-motif cell wall-anchored protein
MPEAPGPLLAAVALAAAALLAGLGWLLVRRR